MYRNGRIRFVQYQQHDSREEHESLKEDKEDSQLIEPRDEQELPKTESPRWWDLDRTMRCFVLRIAL